MIIRNTPCFPWLRVLEVVQDYDHQPKVDQVDLPMFISFSESFLTAFFFQEPRAAEIRSGTPYHGF